MEARTPAHRAVRGTNARIATGLFAGFVMLVAVAAGPVQAAGILVNTLADGSVAGACTLRDAITAAHTDAAVNDCAAGSGADTITFSVSGMILLASQLELVAGSAVTIDGSGQAITISPNKALDIPMRAMFMQAGATLGIQNVTVANGFTDGGGGVAMEGIGTLNISGATFADNAGVDGGGAILGAGTVSITNSTFTGNQAASGGAVLCTQQCSLSVSHSTFAGNHASLGGGIRNDGQLTVANSTFSGNGVTGGGGGIYNTATATIINSTFSGNLAAPGGGFDGGGILNGGTLNLANTILANSPSGGDCSNNGESVGTINPSGTNLIADGSCAVPGALTGNPMLGPLANNGGPTMTHALTAASTVAIDAGDNTVCASYATDQRGSPRNVDGDGDGTAVCDLGAYEFSTLYAFNGFFAPVDNLPVVNTVKAGRAIPVKFSLGGYQGLSIFAASSPSSQQVTCDSGAPAADVEQTAAAGGSSLTYDPATDTYTYVWKTDKAWAGTCRQLVVQLSDGSFHLATFQMK